jgi:hypothetical protein
LSLQAAAASEATAVRLIPQWYQDNVSATSIYYRGYEGPFVTSSDEQFVSTIQQANSLGMQVMLSPMVNPNWARPENSRDGYPGAACLLWRMHKQKSRPIG